MSPELLSFALDVLARPGGHTAELCPCSRGVQTTSGLCTDCDDAHVAGRRLAAQRAARTRQQARRAALAAIAA